MSKRWIQDIMNQKFTIGTFVDPTRLIMISALIKDGIYRTVYLRSEVLRFIYQTYIDNPEIALRNSNLAIRNIGRYGLEDISNALEEALCDWADDSVNGILTYDTKYIYLDIDDSQGTLVASTTTVLKMLYAKYFKLKILTPTTLTVEDVADDLNLELFGKGRYRNRVLEDMQYCPLCEETDLDNLYAVHIVHNKNHEVDDSSYLKENGLIMCREHAEAYNKGLFSFSATGFVSWSCTDLVNTKMRLSFRIKTKGRKKFLEKLEEL